MSQYSIFLRKLPHKLRQLKRSLTLLFSDRDNLRANSGKLWHAWRAGGVQMFKRQ